MRVTIVLGEVVRGAGVEGGRAALVIARWRGDDRVHLVAVALVLAV